MTGTGYVLTPELLEILSMIGRVHLSEMGQIPAYQSGTPFRSILNLAHLII